MPCVRPALAPVGSRSRARTSPRLRSALYLVSSCRCVGARADFTRLGGRCGGPRSSEQRRRFAASNRPGLAHRVAWIVTVRLLLMCSSIWGRLCASILAILD
jgi:hypothetical protein